MTMGISLESWTSTKAKLTDRSIPQMTQAVATGFLLWVA